MSAVTRRERRRALRRGLDVVRRRRPGRPREVERASARAGRRARTAGGRRRPATSRRDRQRQDVAGRELARGDELLSHLLQGSLLARERSLHAVADGVGDAAQVADEPPHPLGHEREGVVGALPCVVQREVLLDDARSEHVADERHRDPALVIREPDDEVGEALAVRLDHTEVELLDLARVRRGALHHAELRVEREDRVDRALDVLDRAAARRQEDRPSEAATWRSSGVFVRSPDAILNAGMSSSARKSALGSSNTVPKSVIPSSRENSRSSSHSAAESSSASRCSPYVRPKECSLSYGAS